MAYTATNFYNDEMTRLQQKQANASTILSSNQRISLLNDSYRKRYAKYVQILIVFVLAFLAYLGVTAIQTAFPIIPSVAVDIITAILIAIVMFYLIDSAYELASRDTLNYDELNLPAYDNSTGINANALAASGRIMPDFASTCVGEECCVSGNLWNAGNNKCSYAGFTTLEYSALETAYTDTAFDSPTLKRVPLAENVKAIVGATSLVVSNV